MPKNNELEDLIAKYEEAIAESKSVYFDADQFGEIADYYDSLGDMDAANELLEIALKIHPESEVLLLKKAKMYLYNREFEKALKIASTMGSGYDLEVYMVKIECLLQLEKYGETDILVQAIFENEGDRDDFYIILADLGYLYSEADLFEDAIELFKQSAQLDSENIEVLSDLAYAEEMAGNYKNAILTTNIVLDIDAYNYDAWINLGKLHSLQEDYAKAAEAFDFALTIEDHDINILKLKAHCLSLSGNAMEAMLIFREILKDTPYDNTIYLLLSECYSQLELFTEALECLEKYKTDEGDTISYITKKAMILMQMDKASLAQSLVESAMETHGRQIDLLTLAGDINMAINEFELAEQDYKEAYLQESDNFDIIDKLAIIAINRENYTDSIIYTEELLILEPENNEVKQRLALLYFEIDDKDEFNKILNSFSDEELMDLFKLFYQPQQPQLFDRELLISSLNEAREYRTLFKTLRH